MATTKKNLLQSRDVYNRYYGDFRGVDFSSDHTQVHDQRLAYSVNMYKDYQSAQGQAIETIPGFRKRIKLDGYIYGIHTFDCKDSDGNPKKHILVHSGNYLYLVNLSDDDSVTTVPRVLHEDMNERKSTSFVMNNRLYLIDGKNYLYYDGNTVTSVDDEDNVYIPTTYKDIVPYGETATTDFKKREWEQINLLTNKVRQTFLIETAPDDYKFELPLIHNSDFTSFDIRVKPKYEIKNDTSVFAFDENTLKNQYFDANSRYWKTNDGANSKEIFSSTTDNQNQKLTITFYLQLPTPFSVEVAYDTKIENISGLNNTVTDASSIIKGCTIATVYDNRVFLSGNPEYPNHVFYNGINDITGYSDPSYFGILNMFQDGIGSSPVVAMMQVADSLLVLKSDTQQDGAVYYHTPQLLESNVLPVIYPVTQGLAGTGCLGACTNFLDDPVFISRFGVEAIGSLSIRYERAIEHRSSLIDAKLLNLGIDNLKNAVLEEWSGYLLLLVDGKIFMADSRQTYSDSRGIKQYEWYYLEDIGIYEDQYLEYYYSKTFPDELKEKTFDYDGEQIPIMLADNVYDYDTWKTTDLRGTVANAPESQALVTERDITYDNDKMIKVYCVVKKNIYIDADREKKEGYVGLLCETSGSHTGGTFKAATVIKNIDNNIYFGTEDGHLCSFNFDKRDEHGEIPYKYYSFNNRTIFCGCATKMDNCGIPHLTKSTVKKSAIIKTKSMACSSLQIKVRTNRKPYERIERIGTVMAMFDDVDFSDFSFVTTEQSLFNIKEKEKQWVEKQYFIYSNEYCRPFALFYLAFRYNVAGRYKE